MFKNLVMVVISTSVIFNSALFAQDSEKTETQYAQEITKTLLQTLGKNLKMHMKKEGPLGAAKFCTLEALNITESVNVKYGEKVDVKRISLKYRNPVNKPTQEEAKVLEKLEQLKLEGKLPKIYVQKNEKANVYYKPLVIKKNVCLKCHGNIAKLELKAYLSTTYVDDKALGYKMGDLRGAIVVTITK